MPEELVTTACDASDEVLSFLRAIAARYAEQDVDGLLELMTEDVVYADHRPLSPGGTVTNRAEMRAFARTTFEMLPDFEVRILVLAQDGDTYLARDTYNGHAFGEAGGGEALMQWWVVDTLRDGKLAREDIYGTEDEARAEFEKRTVHPLS